jgi:alkylhydroperoxidase family enzyme
MPRIPGIDPTDADEDAQRVFAKQTRKWGAPLANHLVYARRPTIYSAARGMWAGLTASGLLDGQLVALLNLRVAQINGCVF